MINLTDNTGRMLPAIRNLITLVLCTVFFVFGWFGHMNWSHRSESKQLIKDAEVSIEIREKEVIRYVQLQDNITNAKQVEQTECKCGDATDIEFMLELRKNRKEGP